MPNNLDDLLSTLHRLPPGTKYRLVAGNTSGLTPDFGTHFFSFFLGGGGSVSQVLLLRSPLFNYYFLVYHLVNRDVGMVGLYLHGATAPPNHWL
jgi:hypothetical protein